MKRNYFKAFTLVELIIVITILAILATIAFMSFQNYYNTSRDSVRVSDIKIIYDGLSVYKIKTGKYPLPDAFVDISAGIQKLTHQGEIGKNIKSIISVSGKANDPKDHTNYIYAIDVKNQKGQLMTFLEKGTDIRHLSLFPQMYASSTDYSERPVYIYGDTLGIVTDENKTPIQYTTGTGVNLLDDEYIDKELNTYIGGDAGDGGKTTATGTVLVTQIESSLSGSLSCGSRSYSGYTLTGLAHDETGTFTKENPISDGTQYLELTIECINGSYDTTNASETITSVQCTTSNYVPHNNSCVENKCSGSIPDNAHSTALTQNHLTSWTYNEPNSLCSFECDLNYTYDVGSNTCKANSRTESCSSIPNNASYNSVDTISQTWSGSVWLPSHTSIHEGVASTSECRFTCNSGYTYDAGSNTCVGNSCTIPATESYNSKSYTIASPGTLLHNNSVPRTGTTSFGVSPTDGTMTADFVYTCNAGVLSKTVSNTGGSCGTGYSFNNNYSSPACSGNSCTTPTSGVHSGLTYTLTSQSVAHGASATVTSANRAFGTSPANGTTSAKFTYSCNAGVITLTSTANNAGSCGAGYTFNNNYSSPACSANSCNLPWGGTINNGNTVTAYSSSSATSPTTCSSLSETRTCTNGVLSGSFTNQNCTQNYRSCTGTPWGTVPHGYSNTSYSTTSVSCGGSCSSYAQTRTCNDGILSGSYSYSSCSVSACANCNLGGYGTLSHGGGVWSYSASSVSCGGSCSQNYISCNNGSLSGGSYYYGSCSVQSCNGIWTDFGSWGPTCISTSDWSSYGTTTNRLGQTCLPKGQSKYFSTNCVAAGTSGRNCAGGNVNKLHCYTLSQHYCQ